MPINAHPDFIYAEKEYYSAINDTYQNIMNPDRKDEIKKIDDALPFVSNFGGLVYFFQNQA